jgi:hypothetical protein
VISKNSYFTISGVLSGAYFSLTAPNDGSFTSSWPFLEPFGCFACFKPAEGASGYWVGWTETMSWNISIDNLGLKNF